MPATGHDPGYGTDGREARRDAHNPALSVPAWYAVRLRVHREFRVRDAIAAEGIEVYLPTVIERRRWSDREQIIEKPIFQGYLFIHTGATGRDVVRQVAGVAQILADPIPAAELDVVRRVATLTAADIAECSYVAGELVEVESGPLAGARGVVERMAGKTRLIVAIELLRRAVSVAIAAKDLKRADRPMALVAPHARDSRQRGIRAPGRTAHAL